MTGDSGLTTGQPAAGYAAFLPEGEDSSPPARNDNRDDRYSLLRSERLPDDPRGAKLAGAGGGDEPRVRRGHRVRLALQVVQPDRVDVAALLTERMTPVDHVAEWEPREPVHGYAGEGETRRLTPLLT